MTQLTRENIEATFNWIKKTDTVEFHLIDEIQALALSGLDAQKRIAELEKSRRVLQDANARLAAEAIEAERQRDIYRKSTYQALADREAALNATKEVEE